MRKHIPLTCIAFDADDTLWENQRFYSEAERRFYDIMRDLGHPDLASRFFAIESQNMDCLGYGAKAMTMSMFECAAQCVPALPSDAILKIVDIGKFLLSVPTVMFDGAVETLHALQKNYRVVIITKGELNEQQRKFKNSPLHQDIDYLVVHDKTPETYAALFAHEKIDPSTLLMVGNSPKSDVLPILELGGWAAYIPADHTWQHEHLTLPDHPKLLRPANLLEILNLI
ncbi:MAG: HAD family hydrolase [Proteobacteria bacterium]|nr:HAD family hydrolase [Pseudomonadota bacterium]